jgi:hypothetical protein
MRVEATPPPLTPKPPTPSPRNLANPRRKNLPEACTDCPSVSVVNFPSLFTDFRPPLADHGMEKWTARGSQVAFKLAESNSTAGPHLRPSNSLRPTAPRPLSDTSSDLDFYFSRVGVDSLSNTPSYLPVQASGALLIPGPVLRGKPNT